MKIVGFNGMPIKGSTGVRALVIKRPDGTYTNLEAGEFRGTYEEDEIKDYRDRGLLTLLYKDVAFNGDPDTVALYAHVDFLWPETNEISSFLSFPHQERICDVESIVTFLGLEGALSVLFTWGQQLFEKAQWAMEKGLYSVAESEAGRCLRATAGLDPNKVKNLRLDACEVLRQSLIARGLPTDGADDYIETEKKLHASLR